jgi:hypothetical protein
MMDKTELERKNKASAEEAFFEEITAIFAKRGFSPSEISNFFIAFSNQWETLCVEHLRPMSKLLRRTPLTKYLEKRTLSRRYVFKRQKR